MVNRKSLRFLFVHRSPRKTNRTKQRRKKEQKNTEINADLHGVKNGRQITWSVKGGKFKSLQLTSGGGCKKAQRFAARPKCNAKPLRMGAKGCPAGGASEANAAGQSVPRKGWRGFCFRDSPKKATKTMTARSRSDPQVSLKIRCAELLRCLRMSEAK
jgi:hypothetical protein